MKEKKQRGLLRYLDGFWRQSILAPLFKLLEALFDLLVPLVVAEIINVGINQGDTGVILRCCGLLVLLGVVGLACSITAQWFAAQAAIGYASAMRHDLFRHIQTLDFSQVDVLGGSTLITRLTSDINQVQNGLNMFLRLFMRSPFIVFGSVVLAFTIDWKVALVFVVTVPVLSLIVFGLMRLTSPMYRRNQDQLDSVLRLTRENLTGVRVVRAFGQEQAEETRFRQENQRLTNMQLKVGRLSALMNPMTYAVVNLGVVAVLYVGARQVEGGVLLNGDIYALVNYMSQILVELVKLANTIVLTTKAMACAGPCQVHPGGEATDALSRAEGLRPGRRGGVLPPCGADLRRSGRGEPAGHQFFPPERADPRHHRRHRERKDQCGPSDLPLLRCHLRPGKPVWTAHRGLSQGPGAGHGGSGHAACPALCRHHSLQPAVGQPGRCGAGAVGRAGDRPGRGLCPGQAPLALMSRWSRAGGVCPEDNGSD